MTLINDKPTASRSSNPTSFQDRQLPDLVTLEACQEFVRTRSPSEVAARLLHDQKLCRNGKGIPSILVHCLPSTRDKEFTNAIARKLCDLASADETHIDSGPEVGSGIDPEKASKPWIPLSVARMRYSSIVAGIKVYLANLGVQSLTEEGKTEEEEEFNKNYMTGEIPQHLIPSSDDFHSALKVLRYLQLPHTQHTLLQSDVSLGPTSIEEIEKIMSVIQSQIDFDDIAKVPGRSVRSSGSKPSCYICRFFITTAHPLYPSLCHPCGEFNIASSNISLPHNLALKGKTALVTGGRINLGFHTALRLLRCGAHVIVSTRYPQDARSNYLEENDSDCWKGRLKIIGADFRAARDVFDLVAQVKETLKEWGSDKLDILINNAAQTLTDTVEKEQGSILREMILKRSAAGPDMLGQSLVAGMQYQPRLRGGGYVRRDEKVHHLIQHTPLTNDDEKISSVDITRDFKSSWVQGISEIPYEDVVTAYSINTLVPFILLRELLPLLRSSKPHAPPTSGPVAYVINVSSREGIPEREVGLGAKAGHHVHTNMSKAALNMLTETEAARSWKQDKISINSVDPGYMSADPMWMQMVGRADQECPIGWEDGAARVLWPIARGEVDGIAVWGRFLKHFTQVNVNRWD